MNTASRRERNKSDKLQRIRQAARHLFGTQGFDSTSTRDIATRANVGLATLFLYASDKRDLLFLACNDDLEALTERALESVDYGARLLDQLTDFFYPFFSFYGQNKLLSRDLLRELTFFTSGRQSARFQHTRQLTISRIEDLVAKSRARGIVRCPSPDMEIAEVIFYLFAAEVRRWLGQDTVSTDDGVARFARLLQVVISGLEVSPTQN